MSWQPYSREQLMKYYNPVLFLGFEKICAQLNASTEGKTVVKQLETLVENGVDHHGHLSWSLGKEESELLFTQEENGTYYTYLILTTQHPMVTKTITSYTDTDS